VAGHGKTGAGVRKVSSASQHEAGIGLEASKRAILNPDANASSRQPLGESKCLVAKQRRAGFSFRTAESTANRRSTLADPASA
jgi:hypothetical protein